MGSGVSGYAGDPVNFECLVTSATTNDRIYVRVIDPLPFPNNTPERALLGAQIKSEGRPWVVGLLDKSRVYQNGSSFKITSIPTLPNSPLAGEWGTDGHRLE